MRFASITLSALLSFVVSYSGAQHTQEPFRQKVSHHITVELDDVRHVLTGTDSLIYQNNSNDTLTALYFHVWPNAYRKGSVLSEQLLSRGNPSLHNISASDKGEITGLIFRNRGRALRWTPHGMQEDIVKLDLPTPLYPDSTLVLNIMFRLQVPQGGAGSLGHSNTSYFLSHWFPRPAVYQHDGWRISSLQWKGRNTGEFSDFNVTVTLPRNYIVASSGQLYDEPVEEKWVKNIGEKTRKVKRWGKRDDAAFPGSLAKTKTIRMELLNASDFALCFDKRFHHLRDTLVLSGAEDTIGIHLYFTAFEAEYWSKSMEQVKKALRYMISETGPYPYRQFTMVQTYWYDQDETYPGLVRIGAVMAPYMLETAVFRQVALHWFSAAMELDGRKNPWVAYGLADYYLARYQSETSSDTITLQDVFADPAIRSNLAGMKTTPLSHLPLLKLKYLSEDQSLPADLPVQYYTRKGFGKSVTRSAMAFKTLRDASGSGRFDRMMQQFYLQWMMGYPTPEDLKGAMTEALGEAEVAWFYQMLASPSDPDLRFTGVKKVPDGYLLTVRNRRNLPIPYPVTATGASGIKNTIWYPPHTGTVEILFPDATHSARVFVLDDNATLPERFRSDNYIRTKGVFRKVEPIRVVPLAALPDPRATQISLAPVAGWNHANGILLGIASYSNPILKPKTEYLLMPLYGVKNNSPAGVARIQHAWFPMNRLIGKVTTGLELKQFGLENKLAGGDAPPLHLSYSRVMPWVELQARKTDPVSDPTIRLTFRMMLINREKSRYDVSNEWYVKDESVQTLTNEMTFRYRANRINNPFIAKASVLQMGRLLRFSTEENWMISYQNPGKGFTIRAFTGIVLIPDDDAPFFAGFTTGGVAVNTKQLFRIHDPWFDHLYLARTDIPGILRQHFYRTDGGFSRLTTVGNTNRWMFTLNMATTLPGRLPFQLYLDAGLFADDTDEHFFKGMFLYSSGVKVNVIRNVAEIYLPFTFFESKAFQEREQLNKLDLNYFQKIRFVLNLNALNPLDLPSRIRF